MASRQHTLNTEYLMLIALRDRLKGGDHHMRCVVTDRLEEVEAKLVKCFQKAADARAANQVW